MPLPDACLENVIGYGFAHWLKDARIPYLSRRSCPLNESLDLSNMVRCSKSQHKSCVQTLPGAFRDDPPVDHLYSLACQGAQFLDEGILGRCWTLHDCAASDYRERFIMTALVW